MKFLSVFVLSLALLGSDPVRSIIVETKYREPISWIPNKQKGEPKRNVQVENQTSGPILETAKEPVNAANTNYYPSAQSVDYIRGQPSSVQNSNRIGPGLLYQKALSAPDIQNAVQQKRKQETQLPLQAAAFQQTALNPKLRALYEASKPTKRYTIIHTDGTVEHTDELNYVVAKHPNYVMVKADEVLARNQNPSIQSSVNRQNKLPLKLLNQQSQIVKPSVQVPESSTLNTRNGWKSLSAVTATNAKALPQSINLTNQLQQSSTILSILNDKAKSPIQVTPQIKSSLQNSYKMKSVKPEIQRKKAVAANPLPIYPDALSQDTIRYEKGFRSGAAAVADKDIPVEKQAIMQSTESPQNNENETLIKMPVVKTVGEGVFTYDLSPMNSNNSLETKANYLSPLLLKQPTKAKSPSEIIVKKNSPATSSIVLPLEVLPTPNNNPNTSTVLPEVTTQPSLNKIEELRPYSNSLNVTNLNEKLIDTNKTSTNGTNTIEVVKNTELKNLSSAVQNVSSITPTADVTWFELKDDSLWEYIQNSDRQNVFFFFMPPEPKISKEIRTTIFPNGTKVEEITETVSSSQYDSPKVIKTSSVVEKAASNKNE